MSMAAFWQIASHEPQPMHLVEVVLVEAAIAVGGLAVERILDGDRRLEDVFPRGIGGEDVAQGHGAYLSISGG